MQSLNRKTFLSVDAGVFLLLAPVLLLIPLKWVAAWFLAALLHEALHCIAVYLAGSNLARIHIGAGGAVIYPEPMSPGREFFCVLAGPAACLLGLAVCRYFPRFAICTVLQSLYNLLPFSNLDGGRAISCILRLLFGEKKADVLTKRIEQGSAVLLAAGVIYGTIFAHFGCLPLLFTGVLLLRNHKKALQR